MTDPRGTEPRDAGEDSDADRRKQLGRLILVVALAIALSIATGSFPTLAVLAAVIAMIMLHELGHFAAAKLGGMKVTEYFLGFGPRVWSLRKGETEYGVKALPLGGYVKIIGMTNLEEVPPEDEARTYRQQSFPRRLAVAVAGSFMHFVIAFVLLIVLIVGLGTYREAPVIASVSKGQTVMSPAEQAGFKEGDHLLAFDGRPFRHWDELRAYIRARPGTPIQFTVERGAERLQLTATPTDANPEHERVGFVGIGPKIARERAGPITGVGRAGHLFGENVVLTVKAIGSFFSPGRLGDYGGQLMRGSQAKRSTGGTRFISPVGIGRAANQAADSGWAAVLILLIGLNIGVGIFNMMPLLPLDGGHVAIAVYERIRSRHRPYHADVTKLMPVTFAVVGVLIVIVVSSLWLDITHPLSNPFQ